MRAGLLVATDELSNRHFIRDSRRPFTGERPPFITFVFVDPLGGRLVCLSIAPDGTDLKPGELCLCLTVVFASGGGDVVAYCGGGVAG